MPEYVEIIYCDVLVCGSGPAGIGAALASAMTGANVMLLESATAPGGTICAVPWMPVNRMYLRGGQRSKPHQMLINAILNYGDDASCMGREDEINGDGISPHPLYAEMAIYDVLDQAKIRYRMNSPVINCEMAGNCVTGVIAHEKRGNILYRAQVIIDATGDGDIAAAAGCKFTDGEEASGIHMPLTLGFSLGGIDKKTFFDWFTTDKTRFYAIIDQEEAKGRCVAKWYSFNPGTLPGIIGVNHGAWRGQDLRNSGLNADDLTAARKNGLRIAIDLVDILRENHVPGTQTCFLDQAGHLLGIRDTRRILGDYVLSYDDTQKNTNFEDGVGRKYGYIDANQVFKGSMFSGYLYPYRCMLPQGINGLLVAGRCGSASFLGHSAGKSMGNMMEIGIAAGVAAAICAREHITPRSIDVGKLQRVLREKMDVQI